MIFTASAIGELHESGKITIDPFDQRRLGSVSYRFSLGDYIVLIDQAQDSKKVSQGELYKIPNKGFLLQPDRLYLASTYETLGSISFPQMIFGLKQLGDLGIYLDISANLGHIGAVTKWTLEITVVQPIMIYARQLVGQITFWDTQGSYDLYTGCYNHRNFPEENKVFCKELNTKLK